MVKRASSLSSGVEWRSGVYLRVLDGGAGYIPQGVVQAGIYLRVWFRPVYTSGWWVGVTYTGWWVGVTYPGWWVSQGVPTSGCTSGLSLFYLGF